MGRSWARSVVPIEPDDTLETLTERVHRAEHRLLVDVLAEHCTDEMCTEPAINKENVS